PDSMRWSSRNLDTTPTWIASTSSPTAGKLIACDCADNPARRGRDGEQTRAPVNLPPALCLFVLLGGKQPPHRHVQPLAPEELAMIVALKLARHKILALHESLLRQPLRHDCLQRLVHGVQPLRPKVKIQLYTLW